MTTITQFTPTLTQNFTFQPTLDGSPYSAIVVWNLFGQRWVLNIFDLTGNLVVAKPLRASPQDYDINLVAGYFLTSTLVYRDTTYQFEVTP